MSIDPLSNAAFPIPRVVTDVTKRNPLGSAITRAGMILATDGVDILTGKWQGLDISQQPQHKMCEVLNISICGPMPDDRASLLEDVKPNVPWAENHFRERVFGQPLNPGNEFRNWPFFRGNVPKHQTEPGFKFSHTYMERFWPKEAGLNLTDKDKFDRDHQGTAFTRAGIRYSYGDLQDVINHLAKDPLSRQAFLPVWFPEDTGVVHGGRVPCTLGYHFIRRADRLHCVYYIRSCDYFRHLRDDVYMAVRLVQHVLDKLDEHDKVAKSQDWVGVQPGTLTMHITSLHCWASERKLLPSISREAYDGGRS